MEVIVCMVFYSFEFEWLLLPYMGALIATLAHLMSWFLDHLTMEDVIAIIFNEVMVV